MEISKEELNPVLAQFNPWWRGETNFSDLPTWRRAVFEELLNSITAPSVLRAILLSGARQVGKTTLLLQVIQELLRQGVPASNIIYITFDHPLVKLAGIDEILNAWREKEVIADSPEYLFLDEAQFIRDCGSWIKHQVDFFKNRRIAFTGSALPLLEEEIESNPGRTSTIRLATLSFYEYLQLKEKEQEDKYSFVNEIILRNIQLHKEFSSLDINPSKKSLSQDKNKDIENIFSEFFPKNPPRPLPTLPEIHSLEELFDWQLQQFANVSDIAIPYVAHFYEYLARGGFPQAAKIESIQKAQMLLREDIVDKILKRDMTALFGVRRIQELEQTFLYLCMHDGGQLNMETLSSNLGVKKQTAKNFIELLTATHLIYRLPRFGYGKEVLRGREKIYLADAAIAPAVFLKGKSFLENPEALGHTVETAAFKHLYVHYTNAAIFTYWLGKGRHEADVIVEQNGKYTPFEIKQEAKADIRDCRGLLEFCKEKDVELAYIVTKSLSEFGLHKQDIAPNTKIMKIPAPLFCYWLGILELKQKQ